MKSIRRYLVAVCLLMAPIFFGACTQSVVPTRGERAPLADSPVGSPAPETEKSVLVEYGTSTVEIPLVPVTDPALGEVTIQPLADGLWGLRVGRQKVLLEANGDSRLEVRTQGGRRLATLHSATLVDALFQYQDGGGDDTEAEALGLIYVPQ